MASRPSFSPRQRAGVAALKGRDIPAQGNRPGNRSITDSALKGRDIFVEKGDHMKKYTAIIEKCTETGLYVGYVPGFPGAHSQGKTLDELNKNLTEVIEMILEDGEPDFDGEFIGTQNVFVA